METILSAYVAIVLSPLGIILMLLGLGACLADWLLDR